MGLWLWLVGVGLVYFGCCVRGVVLELLFLLRRVAFCVRVFWRGRRRVVCCAWLGSSAVGWFLCVRISFFVWLHSGFFGVVGWVGVCWRCLCWGGLASASLPSLLQVV